LTAFLARRRTFFLTAAVLVMIALARPGTLGYLVGLALVALGQAARFWAAGYIVKTEELTVAGPFGWVRNPLYVGSLFIACGYCCMTGGWVVWAVVVPLFFIVHGSAVMWEERFLSSRYGEVFGAYCRSVPRWIPRPPRRAAAGGERFSLVRLKANREHVRCLPTMAVVIVFALKLILGR
jgi:protein-S-isoprenylcysteine O-methyltransferase Ste14